VEVRAIDNGGKPGLGAGDTLRLIFDTPTNTPDPSSASSIASFLNFSASLGESYTGTWDDVQTLSIQILNDSATSPYKFTKIGALKVSTQVGIRTADESSLFAVSSRILTEGSWGQHSPPSLVSVIAANGENSSAGLDSNDTITLTFDIDTNEPVAATRSDIDLFLSFSAQIGVDYRGVWITPKILSVVVRNASHAAHANEGWEPACGCKVRGWTPKCRRVVYGLHVHRDIGWLVGCA